MKAKKKDGFVRMSVKFEAAAYDALKATAASGAGETMTRLINVAVLDKYGKKAS